MNALSTIRASLQKSDENGIQLTILSGMSTAIQADLPPELLEQVQAFVEEGRPLM